jgi:hypothetical protein
LRGDGERAKLNSFIFRGDDLRLLPRTEFGYRIERTFWEFLELDSRWSYLIIAGLVAIGAIVNWLLPHGWTIWPLVGAAGLMLMVNEAAQRNNEGVPPMKVYAFFAGAIIIWIVVVAIMSAINPLVLIVGIGAVVYYAVKANLLHAERKRLIAFRRQNKLCIHCGEEADPEAAFCPHCLEEPNPEVATLRRVAAMARSAESIARARSVLTPTPPTTGVAAKEKALLQRKPRTSKH